MTKTSKLFQPLIREIKMEIGDKVQHYSTGSVGTVLDSTYELESPMRQFLVQWEDDRSFSRDSWERTTDLSIIPHIYETNTFISE
tara:strand:- start:555 stop:809 length:255 start_codon:yes stop_codon:yes gene_type:complete